MSPPQITELLHEAAPQPTQALDFERATTRGRRRRRRRRALQAGVPLVAVISLAAMIAAASDDQSADLVVTDDEQATSTPTTPVTLTPTASTAPTTIAPPSGAAPPEWVSAEERFVPWLFNPREALVLSTNPDALVPGGACGPEEAVAALSAADALIWLAEYDPAGPVPDGTPPRTQARERAEQRTTPSQCLGESGDQLVHELLFTDGDRVIEGFYVYGTAAPTEAIESGWDRILTEPIPAVSFHNSIYEQDGGSTNCSQAARDGLEPVVPGADFSGTESKGTSEGDRQFIEELRDGWQRAGDGEGNTVGWISLAEMLCSDPFEPTPIRWPVYEARRSDVIVGYTYNGGPGFVDRETADAPGYDPRDDMNPSQIEHLRPEEHEALDRAVEESLNGTEPDSQD